MRKKFCWVLLLSMVMAMLFTACSSGSVDSVSSVNYVDGYTNGAAYDMVPEFASDMYPDASPASPPGNDTKGYMANRKLVRTANMSCEVKAYDDFIRWLDKSVDEYGGYIENFSESQSQRYSPRLYYSDYRNDFYGDIEAGYYMSRYAYMTIRIPVDFLDGFLAQIGDNANVTSRTSNQDDITLRYIDVESYVKSLTIERDRMMELLASAENLEDILTIESRLSEVRRQLENYTSQLKLMDNQVDFATVSLDVSEVMDFTVLESAPKGYFGRLWLSFKRGCVNTWDWLVNLSFWLAENILALCIWALVIFCVLKFMRKRNIRLGRRRGKTVAAPKQQAAPQDAAGSDACSGTGEKKE